MSEDRKMLELGARIALVAAQAMEVSVEDAEEYARAAREHASAMSTLSVVHAAMGVDTVPGLAYRDRANGAAASAADAFLRFRRVLEEVRA